MTSAMYKFEKAFNWGSHMCAGECKKDFIGINGFVMGLSKETSRDLPARLWCHLPLWRIKLKEMKMRRQIAFNLAENEKLQAVWDGLPEPSQKEIERLYAKLIAQAAKSELRSEAKEKGGSDVEQ